MSEVEALAVGDRIRNLLKLVGAIGNIDFDKLMPIVNKIIEIITGMFPPEASIAAMDIEAASVSVQSALVLTTDDEEAAETAGFDIANIFALIKLIIELFRALKPAPAA